MDNKKVIILGAGVSGLSAALKLAKLGYSVTVLEERDIVGGQALSINHNGVIFDLGPHTWHTLSKDLNMFYYETCKGEDIDEFPKNAAIFLNNNYFSYPLKVANMFRVLQIHTSITCFFKYLIRPKNKRDSAEDYFLSMYGEKIYEMFFKNYIEHVWGIHPSQISSRIFRKTVPNLNLLNLILRTLFGSLFVKKAKKDDDPGYAYEIKMVCPKKGCGVFAANMAKQIKELSGEIYLNSEVIGINHDERIKSVVFRNNNGIQEIDCDYCISSIPVTTFVKGLNPLIKTILSKSDSLFYRSIVIVCLVINREHVSDYQVIYFYNNIFTRIGIMNQFSSKAAPPGKTAITAEVTCFEGDNIWNSKAEELKGLVVDELAELSFFNKEEVKDYTIIKEKYGYPVLKVGDTERLEDIFKKLNSFNNLSVIGRQGRFDYIQMADAVKQGLEISNNVMDYFKR